MGNFEKLSHVFSISGCAGEVGRRPQNGPLRLRRKHVLCFLSAAEIYQQHKPCLTNKITPFAQSNKIKYPTCLPM